MPKIVMHYDAEKLPFRPRQISFIGQNAAAQVAELASTEDVQLDRHEDIDFMPVPYPKGSIMTSPVSFEIITIGSDDRKKKMDEASMLEFRKWILMVMRGSYNIGEDIPAALDVFADPSVLLVWVMFISPDGPHV